MDQAFETFSECVLFRHLERREIETLLTRVRIRDFAAGETIFVIGSPADGLMIVLHGAVQTGITAPKDRPIVLPGTSPKGQPLGRIVSPGEIFGEIALLDGGARLGDAIAVTDCSLAIVNRQDMLSFLEQNPVAWQDIGSVLRERLTHMPVGWRGRQPYADLTEIALLHEERHA
jgi:CRP/FNR family cyclic AMP-dependent transcriptional regulator